MATHRVEQGDCIASIAWTYGFGDWHLIWDAQTDEFRKTRPNPNALMPGDEVTIPERAPKQFSVATKASHTFRVQRPPAKLLLRLHGEDGKPLSGMKYELEVAGASKKLQGQTTNEGLVDQPIPANATTATLTLFTSDSASVGLPIRFGHIDPLQEVTGVQGRLRNLGYFAGDLDGQADEDLDASVRDFQRDQGLDETGLGDGGTPDDKTRDKIENVYTG